MSYISKMRKIGVVEPLAVDKALRRANPLRAKLPRPGEGVLLHPSALRNLCSVSACLPPGFVSEVRKSIAYDTYLRYLD